MKILKKGEKNLFKGKYSKTINYLAKCKIVSSGLCISGKIKIKLNFCEISQF